MVNLSPALYVLGQIIIQDLFWLWGIYCSNLQPFIFQLSNRQIAENSDLDKVVGFLSTSDQDNTQTHSYTLIDSAAGRFKIDGRTLKVSRIVGSCPHMGRGV